MTVNVQYAEEHFADLITAVKNGEEVEITSPDQSAYRLTLANPAPFQRKTPRILGAGVGEMVVPSWEEWKAMDEELEREMLDAPLVSSSKPGS